MVKVAVVGAGTVGRNTVENLAQLNNPNLEIIYHNRTKNKAQGQALDISQAMAANEIDCNITATNNFEDLGGCEVIIVTAGFPRKPGMTREDLLGKNSGIISNLAGQIRKYAPNSLVAVVTNPADAMTYVMQQCLEGTENVVVGVSALDSARFRYFVKAKIEEKLGRKISISDLTGCDVVGPHNPDMVPLVSNAKHKGKPISEVLDVEEIAEIVEQVKTGGKTITGLAGQSSFSGPGAVCSVLVDNVLKREKFRTVVSTFKSGRNDGKVPVGVPVIMEGKRILGPVEIKLSDQENRDLESAIENVTKSCHNCDVFLERSQDGTYMVAKPETERAATGPAFVEALKGSREKAAAVPARKGGLVAGGSGARGVVDASSPSSTTSPTYHMMAAGGRELELGYLSQ